MSYSILNSMSNNMSNCMSNCILNDMSNYSTLEMAKSTLVRAAFEMAALVFSLVVSVRGGICGSGISGDVFCHSRISGVMRGIGIGVVMKHSCMNGSCINSSCMNSSCMNSSCMNRSCMNGSCTNGNGSYMNASCQNIVRLAIT